MASESVCLHACLQVLDTLNALFARDKRGSIVGSSFVAEAGEAGSASAPARLGSTSAPARLGSTSALARLGPTSALASPEPRNAPRDGLSAPSPVLLPQEGESVDGRPPSVRLARARSLVAGKRRMAELRHELRHELVSSQAPSSHGTPPTPRQQLRIEVPQHDRATDGQAIFLIACQCDGQRWTVVRKERSVSELHAALQPSTSCPTLHSRSAAGSGGARRGWPHRRNGCKSI